VGAARRVVEGGPVPERAAGLLSEMAGIVAVRRL
jgi:hypothetical protein